MAIDVESLLLPYLVLCCNGCDHRGVMRFRRLREARDVAETVAMAQGWTCIVFGRDGKEVVRHPELDSGSTGRSAGRERT